MKALTIKQPWASLIAHGIKDIENRTWKTNFRGRIFIHSSANVKETKWNRENAFSSLGFQQFKRLKEVKAVYSSISLVRGAIIGEVDIVDCVENHESVWAEKGVYNWILANAVLYDKPILDVKGRLNFWEYETTTA